jgi:uncharacterized protein YdhG (YjbR/CyaY superfamily)
MKSVTPTSVKVSAADHGSHDPIAAYAIKQVPKHAAICHALRKEIDAALPNATSKVWHAMPVWFVGTNPVVGYKASAKHVNLLFWNDQSFHESGLKAAGKFRAAQVQFTGASQIDVKTLRRWLKQARTDLWDYQGNGDQELRALAGSAIHNFEAMLKTITIPESLDVTA